MEKNRTVYDKVHSQKGNSPEYKLKSLILFLVNKLLTFLDIKRSGCGLGSRHLQRKA